MTTTDQTCKDQIFKHNSEIQYVCVKLAQGNVFTSTQVFQVGTPAHANTCRQNVHGGSPKGGNSAQHTVVPLMTPSFLPKQDLDVT